MTMSTQRHHRRWLVPAALVLSLAVLAACKDNKATPPAPAAVTVAKPVKQAVIDYMDFTGNTAASNTVNLVARVEGYLEKIHFVDGAMVKKGDLLFTIQQEQYKAQLSQAQAQLMQAQAALVYAKTEQARFTALLKQDAASQVNVDHWVFEAATAQASVQSAQAQIILAQLNLSYTEVRAPFDGRIGRHLVDIGNLVGKAGQNTALAELDQIDPLYVYFTINERDLLDLAASRAGKGPGALKSQRIPAFFALLNENDFPHQGELDFASISVSPTTGTLTVRGIFPNATVPPILPGLFVRVRVPVAEPADALVVPGEAVSFDQQGPYVLIVGTDDVVVRRSVKTGRQVGTKLVVEDGLKPDDNVVIAGILQAIPGRKVKPEPESAPKSGG